MNVLLQQEDTETNQNLKAGTVPGGAVCGDGTWVCAS